MLPVNWNITHLKLIDRLQQELAIQRGDDQYADLAAKYADDEDDEDINDDIDEDDAEAAKS